MAWCGSLWRSPTWIPWFTKDSPVDLHAAHNTTSVYPPGRMYPMLPERLSTDLTSLNAGEDRLAMVVEMDVDRTGAVRASDNYRAWVHNRAKLAYDALGAWFAARGTPRQRMLAVPGLAENLRLQDVRRPAPARDAPYPRCAAVGDD